MVRQTVSPTETDQDLTDEMAEAPWGGSHWGDLSTPSASPELCGPSAGEAFAEADGPAPWAGAARPAPVLV